MHAVLENIIKNVKANPRKFQEISEDEISNRDKNLKEKYKLFIKCKEEITSIYVKIREKEIMMQRDINKTYLLNKNTLNTIIDTKPSNLGYKNNINDEINESFDSINENTEKLYNAALIISKELNEQNNLIEGINKNIDIESKLDI